MAIFYVSISRKLTPLDPGFGQVLIRHHGKLIRCISNRKLSPRITGDSSRGCERVSRRKIAQPLRFRLIADAPVARSRFAARRSLMVVAGFFGALPRD
ncbi:hypothetical protein [Nocardia cyriacigeorgica]|uniref:hypothetical protein n=1 Tax=Nocardia cyriacigeorgica TaxID=135487 RepID=UPI002458F67E|nr:hypothetical protein [Nocardia cyriacigeorgica]